MAIYVAAPYTARNGRTVEQNIENAMALGNQIAELGILPVLPQLVTHPFAEKQSDPLWWLVATLELMLGCDAVFMAPNWRESPGCVNELKTAIEAGLPVFYSIEDLAKVKTGYDEAMEMYERKFGSVPTGDFYFSEEL